MARTHRDRVRWRNKALYREYWQRPYEERRLEPMPNGEEEWKDRWSHHTHTGRGRLFKRWRAKRERQRARGHGARRVEGANHKLKGD